MGRTAVLHQLAFGADHAGTQQQLVRGPHAVTQPRQAGRALANAPLGKRHLERLTGKPFQTVLNHGQYFAAVGKDHRVIHVTNPRADLEFVGNEPIPDVAVNVGEKLTGQIANGQARAGGWHDVTYQHQRGAAAHFAGNLGMQGGTVYAGKELGKVHLKNPGEAPAHVGLGNTHTAVSPMSDATGVAVGQECLFKYRLNDVAQRVLHHPVTKRQGRYLAWFWLIYHELARLTGAVAAIQQRIAQHADVGSEILFECQVACCVTLATHGFAISVVQIVSGGDLLDQVSVLLSHVVQ